MRDGRRRVAAVAILAVGFASAVAFLGATVLAWGSTTPLSMYDSVAAPPVFAVVALACTVVGAVVVAGRPGNPVGWLLALLGLGLGVGQALIVYADLALYVRPPLPAGAFAAVAGNVVIALGTAIPLPLLLFLFPTGRPISRRWRRVVVACVAVLTLSVIASILEPAHVGEFPLLTNPLAVGGAGGAAISSALPLLRLAIPLTFGLGVWSLVSRFRRSVGVERLQLRWFAYTASLLGLSLTVSFAFAIANLPGLADAAFGLAMAAALLVFASIGIAMRRYRLYEIDRLVNRTIVYAGVMVLLAGIYLVGVLGLGSVVRVAGGTVVGDDAFGDLLVAASTLAAAAAFRPVRARVQRLVDRRFDRARYDAEQIVATFGTRLRDEVDLDALADDLQVLVSATMRPSTAALWLAPSRTGSTSNVRIG